MPYATSEGSVVFVAAGSEGGTAAIAGNSAKKKDSQSRQIRCAVEGCGQIWPEDKIMTHVAYHVLNGDVTSTFPCGVCGAYETHQFTSDPSAVNACVAWLQTKTGDLVSKSKTGGNFTAEVRCVNAGPHSFPLKVKAHVNKVNPATNTLVQCPFCPIKPLPTVHWSYPGPDPMNPKGMAAHLKNKHPLREIPTELKKQIEITKDEQELVIKAGKEPPTPRKKRTPARPSAASGVSCSVPPPEPRPSGHGDVPPAFEMPSEPEGPL